MPYKSNFFFSFHNDPIWLAHCKKKVETMEASQNKRFYCKMGCVPLWPRYIGEKGGLWAKHMGLKWGDIGNTLGEHIGI